MNTKVIACPHCGAQNRVPLDKQGAQAKCGRCHQPLPMVPADEKPLGILTLRCSACRTKNRVPVAKLNESAKCGRCGAPLEAQDLLSGRVHLVSDGNFEQTVLKSPLPVLLYAWAPWCSVCSGTTSMVDQLAYETKGKIRIGKLNIDANPKLANQYSIMSVPAFLIFDAGQLKEFLPGAVPKHELMIKMAAFL